MTNPGPHNSIAKWAMDLLEIHVLVDSTIQGFRDSGIQGFKDRGFGIRDSG
jgi:hypothetical protein